MEADTVMDSFRLYVECDVCDKRIDHEDDQSSFCNECGNCLEHCVRSSNCLINSLEKE